MKTILAPIDFSPVTTGVLKEASALARAFDGRVVLLNVIQPPVVLNEYSRMIDVAELTAAGERNASRQLDRLAEKLQADFIKTERVQVTGTPVTNILEQADENEVDYIVMGSHGHTAFYDLLVGSTTHGVLMRTKCPVIIVPAVREAAKPKRREKRAVAAK
jgi:nucleotide-binding universal stress UspA family protein